MATYLITGANRGIGTEYCRQLQARGDTVVAACRTPSAELEELGVRIETGVDITSDAAIASLVERLEGLAIDGLIHTTPASWSAPAWRISIPRACAASSR
jgi:NAD(P)-dependent dehydrogenase (short-subunit alcohol dehydrogenase family)